MVKTTDCKSVEIGSIPIKNFISVQASWKHTVSDVDAL